MRSPLRFFIASSDVRLLMITAKTRMSKPFRRLRFVCTWLIRGSMRLAQHGFIPFELCLSLVRTKLKPRFAAFGTRNNKVWTLFELRWDLVHTRPKAKLNVNYMVFTPFELRLSLVRTKLKPRLNAFDTQNKTVFALIWISLAHDGWEAQSEAQCDWHKKWNSTCIIWAP